jgi:asparagine synthase (glutamine-hydrolysing)
VCGIAGAVWKASADESLLHAMTARLAHRGPDDTGSFTDGAVGLGVRRLAIVDPEHGRQPVFSEDCRIVAVCNGEIYNHATLRAELGAAGHRFRSAADTEVLPHLYEAHGLEFLERLRGEFALALYDMPSQRLVLARDPLGVKPLHYIDTQTGFYFASEIKSLLLAPGYAPEVDRSALHHLLAFKHIPGDASLLRDIRCLRAGNVLVYDIPLGTWTAGAFYSLPMASNPAGFYEAAYEVARRLDDAVAARLMSDVPLGVALSGGLDSSAVVASVALQTDRPPTTIAVHVAGQVDELPYARLVADQYRTDHHEVEVAPDSLDQVTPAIMWHLEEPLAISELPTWYLAQAASTHVKVLLCGEGSDELFGGYKRLLPLANLQWLPQPMLAWGYVRGINGLTAPERAALLGPSVDSAHNGLHAASTTPPDRPGGDGNAWLSSALAERSQGVLNRLLRYELREQLRSQVFRLDKLTMAHGVEARCPFLDPLLVDYVAGLPGRFKIRGRTEKVLLRAAVANRLPAAVVERRKLGMSNPVAALFRGDFRDLCRDEFQARRDVLRAYFRVQGIERLFAQVGRRPSWYSLPEQHLFQIFLFLKWHALFVEGTHAEAPP